MRYVAALVIGGWCTGAGAMMCIFQPPEEIARSAKIAFIGTVTAIEESEYVPWELRELCEKRSKDSKCGGKLATVEVSEQIRGQLPSTVTVLKEDGCYCTGGYWTVGSAYLFVARPNTTQFRGRLIASNTCGGTVAANEEAKPIVEALRRKNP